MKKSAKYLNLIFLFTVLVVSSSSTSLGINYMLINNPKSSQGVDLTIHVSDQMLPGVESIVDDFLVSSLGSGVDSVTVVSSGTTADDQLVFLQTLMTGGTATADVISLDVIWTADFAENDWIIPLDPYLEANELDAYAPGLVDACNYKGNYYAYPYFLNLGILFYRKDLLDLHFGAGMWSESDFETWEGLNHTANYILNNQSGLLTTADSGLVGYVGQFDAYEGGVVNFFEWCGSNSALDLISSNFEANINMTKAKEAINFLKGLIAPQYTGVQGNPYIIPRQGLIYDEGSSILKWINNESIFMRQWTFGYRTSEANNMDIGIMPLPHFNGTTGFKTSIAAGSVLAIPSTTTGIARDAAVNFTKFLGDQVAQEAELTTDVDPGPEVFPLSNFPALKSVYLNPPSGFEWIKNWTEQVDLTLSRPVTLDYPSISNIIANYFNDIISCSFSATEGLNKMQEDISNLFTKYYEIFVDNVKAKYTSNSFNLIFYLRDVKDDPIIGATIQAWWNGTEISSSFQDLGNGNYSVSLTPITVKIGEDPILLNMTISALGFEDKYYEKYIAIPPGVLLPVISGYSLYFLISMALCSIVVIYFKLRQKIKE